MTERVSAICMGSPIATEFDLSEDIYSDEDLSIKVFELRYAC